MVTLHISSCSQELFKRIDEHEDVFVLEIKAFLTTLTFCTTQVEDSEELPL